MTGAFLALLPVFAVILIGLGLRTVRVFSDAHWSAVEEFCYFVLFPAIIFKEIAAADFSGVPVLRMALAMILAISTMFALLLAFRTRISAWLGIDGPQFTSVFQGTTRWHTFIALAIIPVYFGGGTLALGAVSAAAMTPVLNVACVIVMSLHAAQHRRIDPQSITLSLIKNPFVFSSLSGVLWQVIGLPLPTMAIQILDMIGKGALGLALLTVGAGLRIDEALSAKAPVIAATLLKLLVMPLFMAFWLMMLGVSGQAAAVAVLCGAVPTGSGAYVLARQMGGDAPLVANILTLQVICAAITIPIVLALYG